MASLVFSSSTENQITVTITGLDTSYANSQRPATLYAFYDSAYSNMASYAEDLIFNGYSSWNMSVNGLSAGQTYYMRVVITYYSDMNMSNPQTLTLDGGAMSTISVRPALFYWDNGKISGNAFNITAAEWNRLTENINAVRVYKGYQGYTFTTAAHGNTFTANHYNQCVVAITGIGYGGGLSYVSTGDSIMASAINALATAVNSIS